MTPTRPWHHRTLGLAALTGALLTLCAGCAPGVAIHTVSVARYVRTDPAPRAAASSASVTTYGYRVGTVEAASGGANAGLEPWPGQQAAPVTKTETQLGLGEAGFLAPLNDTFRLGFVGNVAGFGPDGAVDLWRTQLLSVTVPMGLGFAWISDGAPVVMPHVGVVVALGPPRWRGFVGVRSLHVVALPQEGRDAEHQARLAVHAGGVVTLGRLRLAPEVSYTRADALAEDEIVGLAVQRGRGAWQWTLALTAQLVAR